MALGANLDWPKRRRSKGGSGWIIFGEFGSGGGFKAYQGVSPFKVMTRKPPAKE